MPEEEKPKTDKKESKEAEVVEIPTQYGLAFQIENGDVLDQNQFLAKMYNDIQKIKKAVVGNK